MKKAIALFLSVLFLVSFAGCSKGSDLKDTLCKEPWIEGESGKVMMEFFPTGSGIRTENGESDFTWSVIDKNIIRVENFGSSRMTDYSLEEVEGTPNLVSVSGREAFVLESNSKVSFKDSYVEAAKPEEIQEPTQEPEPEPAQEPEPIPEPEPEPGFPEKTIIFKDGIKITAYVVDVFKYVDDWSEVGLWGDLFSFGSVRGQPFELRGAVTECYGVSFSYTVTATEGDPFEAGFKGGVRFGSGKGKWTYGDYEETVMLKNGDPGEIRVWLKEPQNIVAFTAVTAKVLSKAASWTSNLSKDLKLYFRTEKAAQLYLDSLSV